MMTRYAEWTRIISRLVIFISLRSPAITVWPHLGTPHARTH